ncbi:unnamed protein product, partial [Ixodes pacificus]
RHRPAYGNCLGAFAATFPVAFLEPSHNKHNPHCIHGKAQEHSLEAQAVMATLESSMPTLDDLMGQVEKFVTANGKYTEQPYIIEVMLPMLCRNHVTMVTSDHLTNLLRNILNLLRKTVSVEGSPWMITFAGHAGQIVINSSEELLRDPILPLMEKIQHSADLVFHKEECMRSYLKSSTDDTSQAEGQLQEYFRREEANFISQHEIDNMALIMPSSGRGRASVQTTDASQSQKKASEAASSLTVRRDGGYDDASQVAMQCIRSQLEGNEARLPSGFTRLGSGRREWQIYMIDRIRPGKKEKNTVIFLYIRRIDPSDAMSWQHYLYSKLGSQRSSGSQVVPAQVSHDQLVERIMDMAKVLYGLHMIDHPQGSMKGVYRSVVSTQRKRAVIACFRMISLHSLPSYSSQINDLDVWNRHRAINIFLKIYKDLWLEDENVGQEELIDHLTTTFEDSEKETSTEEAEEKPDPLVQLVVAFSRTATTEHRFAFFARNVWIFLKAGGVFQSCGGAEEEEEEEEGDDDAGPSIH